MIAQVCGDEIDLSGRPTADSGPLEIEPEVFRTELVRAAHWVADYLQNLPSGPVIRPTFWHNTTAMRLVEQAESFLHRGLVLEEPLGGPAR